MEPGSLFAASNEQACRVMCDRKSEIRLRVWCVVMTL